jgi:hypothetical protein
VARGDQEDLVLNDTTRYRGSNQVVLQADLDRGKQGIAEVKFLGGSPRGVRNFRFPQPKPMADSKGRSATIAIAARQKNVQQVRNLQGLYRLADGNERLLPKLPFKKDVSLDIGKIRKVEVTARKGGEAEWWMKLGGGRGSPPRERNVRGRLAAWSVSARVLAEDLGRAADELAGLCLGGYRPISELRSCSLRSSRPKHRTGSRTGSLA